MTIPPIALNDFYNSANFVERPNTQSISKVEVEAEKVIQPKISSLNNFLAWVRSAGLQKSNRFFADIAFPPAIGSNIGLKEHREDFLLACEEVSIPPRNIETRTLRLGGLNERRASTLDYGNDFTLTFYVDNTHSAQQLVEYWMDLAIDRETREVGEYAEYIGTVDLWFLRPFSSNELYEPASRNNGNARTFKGQLANRVTNLAAAEVGKFKTKLQNQFELGKQQLLGSNLSTYNRIRGTIPFETLLQEDPGISDYGMYKISFKEAFPIMVNRTMLNQGNSDVFRISVQFAFKEYTTSGTAPLKTGKKDNVVFNFIKNIGLPGSPSALGRQIISLL